MGVDTELKINAGWPRLVPWCHVLIRQIVVTTCTFKLEFFVCQ